MGRVLIFRASPAFCDQILAIVRIGAWMNDKPRRLRHPPWLKVRMPHGGDYAEVKQLVRTYGLHTVCQSARCPNIGECWGGRTATFMLLGEVCTCKCGFCAVQSGRPVPPDPEEPARIGRAVRQLGLRYAVITSVTRDDLEDGGAIHFAQTIQQIRLHTPNCRVEVLIPDLLGDREALNIIVRARPDVLNHNIETVARLYPTVRPQADYKRSLHVLRCAKELDGDLTTKSGIMRGLGETTNEVQHTMQDLRAVDCDLLTIGQYLQPSHRHLPVQRYVPPREFYQLQKSGEAMGFQHVEAGPLVRSSYHAAKQAASVK